MEQNNKYNKGTDAVLPTVSRVCFKTDKNDHKLWPYFVVPYNNFGFFLFFFFVFFLFYFNFNTIMPFLLSFIY